MFEVGQKVWDVIRGRGVVVSVHSNQDYPVIVDLYSGSSESYTAGGLYQEKHVNPSLYPCPVKVVKAVKPTVNWDHVNSRYNYLAQDESGTCWVYENVPILVEDEWVSSRGNCTLADCLQSLVPGTCSWDDSLVERPAA